MRHFWDRLNAGEWPEDLSSLFANLPELETERLLLRPIRRSDAEDIFAYAADPEVARYVLWEPHKSVSDSRAYIRYMKELYRTGQPSNYAIVLKATGHMIGTIGFMQWLPEHGVVEVGYSIGRTYWNQGITTEALRRFLALCFSTRSIQRVEAMHDPANIASGRVMAKCGMHREGILRQRVNNKGKQCDVALWAIVRQDWQKMQSQPR